MFIHIGTIQGLQKKNPFDSTTTLKKSANASYINLYNIRGIGFFEFWFPDVPTSECHRCFWPRLHREPHFSPLGWRPGRKAEILNLCNTRRVRQHVRLMKKNAGIFPLNCILEMCRCTKTDESLLFICNTHCLIIHLWLYAFNMYA